MGDPVPPAANAALVIGNGAIMPAIGAGANAGITFPPDPRQNNSHIQYVNSGNSSKLTLGIKGSGDAIVFERAATEQLALRNNGVFVTGTLAATALKANTAAIDTIAGPLTVAGAATISGQLTASGPVLFIEQGTERARFAGGRLGIGIASPRAALEVTTGGLLGGVIVGDGPPHDPQPMNYPFGYETIGVARSDMNLRLQSPGEIFLHTRDLQRARIRRGSRSATPWPPSGSAARC